MKCIATFLISTLLLSLRLSGQPVGVVSMTSPHYPVVRLAILDFKAEGATNTLAMVGDVCEHLVFEGLARDTRLVLVEREQIRKLTGEHDMSAKEGGDTLRLGEMLSADWLLMGRVRSSPAGVTVEASVLEVASGNILLTVGANVGESAAQGGRRLLRLILTNLPSAFEAREKDRTKPAVAILTVKNTSRIRRLDYLLPVIGRLLETATLETGKYRILRRQQAGLARQETELSFAGWTQPADAVIARHADVVISVEMQEQYRPGLAFKETPVELKARIERNHGLLEEVVVSGLVGKKDVLLRLLAEKVRIALCGDSKVVAGVGADRILEASRLLEEAVGDGSRYDRSGTEAPDISERQRRDAQIGVLEKALYLDPGLFEARYWLGCFLRSGFSFSSRPAESLAVMERAIRELELYLQNSLPDGQEHDLGKTSESMSREPGALHEKAQHDLIFCYQSLWSFVDICAERPTYFPVTPEQKVEWGSKAEDSRRRMIELVIQYVTEPPKKHMVDQIDFLPLMALRAHAPQDTQPWIDWTLFLNSIYGKDHDNYNVRCPFLRLAGELLRAGKPDAALEYYERGLTEHQHRITEWHDTTLAKINRALGKEAKAKEIEEIFYGEWRKNTPQMDLFGKLEVEWQETHTTAAPPLPQAAVKTVGDMPQETEVLACASHRTGRYLFLAGQGIVVGFGVQRGRRDRYRLQKLFHQPSQGAPLEDLPIIKNGNPARVTVILPLGDFIWFGTHEGLARFDPGAKAWRWFGPKEGLPTNYILCGTVANGKLWLCGGADDNGTVVFSFDPATEEVQAYLPDREQSLFAVSGMEVLNTHAFVAHSFGRLFGIDLVSGKWEQVEIMTACGKRAARGGELGQSYAAVTAPVVCGGRWWIGITGGLAVMETNAAAFRSVFSSGFPYRQLDGCVPASQRNCPLSGCVTALASDQDLLWVICNGLAAYDPKQDTWYGPLSFPDPIAELVADGTDVWVLGPETLRVKRTEFLQAARAAGLCQTTAEFQRALGCPNNEKRY